MANLKTFFKFTQNIWIYLLSLTLASISQEFEYDIESLIGDNLDLISEHTQTLRSGDQIYDSHFYAADFLRDFNNELRQWRHASAQVDWNYKTNLTDSNRNQKLKIDSDFENWWRRKLKEAKKFRQEALPETFSRQLAMITLTATSEKNDLNRRRDFILSRMEAIYGSTKACLTRNSCLPLEPSLVDIMTKSRDPEFLKETWLQWRNSIGPKVRPYFTQLIQILNEAAVENGFSDYSDFWKQDLFFNTSTLDATIITLWTEVKPFYQQLHAYVRRKLRERYGSGIIGIDGAIPAHLLGNMWAQHWPNILDIVSPYPELNQQPSIEARLRKSFNVHGMFRLANTFYTSLGLYPMSSTFWDKSMFTKPRDRNVVCHASAFDLYFPGDFRLVFNLRPFTLESSIHNLLSMALEKLAFLPFGLFLDIWRWDVMKGKITEENYNKKWWEMRLQYQGLRSPVPRSEQNFDPGAKYHIISNSPYISYFISYIQQFQMFQSLCQVSGYKGPLHKCDIYGSREAGRKLKHTLHYGSSIPWQDQLEHLTGSKQVKSDAILEYFRPLYDWLVLDNIVHKEKIGWNEAEINWIDE
uniref:Angiotensin-converting enzyme n=1 Tax=Biomphalaria glabrata TaxID=6526 RepID=A0A2C9JLJ8_BIOGL